MYATRRLCSIACHLLVALVALLIAVGQANGQDDKDPHRPACTSSACRKIKSFVKTHYCGESPFGNGPDDGCEIRIPKKLGSGIEAEASFDCKWIEGVRKCEQHVQPAAEVRGVLVGELRRLGLPTKAPGPIYFNVWKSIAADLYLAEAFYEHVAGDERSLCQVIATIDRSSHVQIMRKVPFQKTDVDKPAVTTWSLIDLADVDGNGHIDVVLEGDAYEDHWLEVDNVQGGVPRTIFSGLGYYL